MATLHQYFETDFSNTLRVHALLEVDEHQITATVLYDFTGYNCFFACYVPEENRKLPFFLKIIDQFDNKPVRLIMNEKVTLPNARDVYGKLKIENKEDFEVLSLFHEDTDWISTKDLILSPRFFIYSESELSGEEVIILKNRGRQVGKEVQFRTRKYAMERSKIEIPLAFISHDSRDKDAVARRIAVNLESMQCPVWYDEFSLVVGSSLRESIEKGLKECNKCILVLSPSFISNKGWTKREFNSIFTREILEESNLVLPVWYNVTKEMVYEYSPSLLDIKGVDWNTMGEEKVCNQLCQVIKRDLYQDPQKSLD